MTESWVGRHGPYVLLLAFLYYCLQIAMAIFGDWFDLFEMLPITANAIVVLLVASLVGIVAAIAQGRRWHAAHGLPGMVAVRALFSVNQDFWRDTDAQRLLMH